MDNQNNQNNNPNNQNNNQNGPQKKQSLFMLLIAVLITIMGMSFFMSLMSGSDSEISYSEFLKMVKAGEVESVLITDTEIEITPKEKKVDANNKPVISTRTANPVTYYTGNLEDDNLYQILDENDVEYKKEIPDNSGLVLNFILTWIVPALILYLLLTFLMKKMGGGDGPMGVGKSKAKVYVQKETGVTFKDVAGEEEAKESLQEVVDFLHNPAKYTQIGAKLPKGALLVGPPGTGKTLLAKAVAGEAHVPFFSLTGSDFVELYVGVGASRVRDLFKEANKNAPCIIFIDEIDAIGRSRDSKYGGGNEEREQTLNQLLSEMDGFDSSKGILILAATNRPEILDKALLRPGRFDRRVIVEKPDLKGRVDILKVHSKDVLLDESVDLDEIALATSGAVGADLANMVNEAAINAVKEGRKAVSQKDLFGAVEVVLVGKEKKDRIMSKEERKIVSYHEVGHALVSALQKNSEPVQKITIVPRTMGALGYVMHVPEEEKYLNTEAELRDMLVDEAFLIQHAAWNKLYHRDLLGEDRFPEGKWYEDIVFSAKILSRVKTGIYLDNALYNYVCEREDSIMNAGMTERIFTDRIPAYLEKEAFLAGLESEEPVCIHRYYFYKRLLVFYRDIYKRENKALRRYKKYLIELVRERRNTFAKVYQIDIAAKTEEIKIKLFVFSPFLFRMFMAVNDTLILPHRLKRMEKKK